MPLLIEIIELGELQHRKPDTLSGGQKQRVALGRAMARKPEVFLMDEPLSNLDAKMRAQFRAELFAFEAEWQMRQGRTLHDALAAAFLQHALDVVSAG